MLKRGSTYILEEIKKGRGENKEVQGRKGK